jgi:hypothetical protein
MRARTGIQWTATLPDDGKEEDENKEDPDDDDLFVTRKQSKRKVHK